MHPNDTTPFVKIPLTQGKVALVSPEDFEVVSSRKWFADKHKNGFYAATNVYVGNRRSKKLYLHRMLCPDSKGPVDHKNRNGLDNRRDNIRPSTHEQNAFNAKKRSDNTSGHRGVYRARNKWVAYTTYHKKRIWIGRFVEKEDAIAAYNEFVKKLHQEFFSTARKRPQEQ